MEAISTFVEAFHRQQDQHKRIEKEVESLCRTLLDGKIKFSWQSRVKDAHSLKEKLEARRHKYQSDIDNINDVKDLVAGRIILTRWKDFPLVEKAIAENFQVKSRSQHPKSEHGTLQQRFRGYDGLHLYVTRNVSENEPYSSLLIEIQVQSAFMWAFSTLEHDIIYKELHGNPDPNLVSNLEILKGIANLGEVALEQYDELLSSDSKSPFSQGPDAQLNLPSLIGQFAQDKKDTISRKLQAQKETKKITSWVSNAYPERDHNQVRTTLGFPYHNSGSKFRPIYDAWILCKEKPVFWLSGAVGTGKSSLVSRIVEWHFNAIQSENNQRLALFYCSRKSGKRTSPLDVLCSLIAQLAASLDGSSISPKVAEQYGKRASRPIEIQECPELLTDLVKEYQKTTIIIDALDECENADVLLLRLRELLSSTAGAPVPVKFFFSSRKQVEVDQVFQQCEKLEIGNGTDLLLDDMKTYINIQVKEREALCLGSRLLQGRYPELEDEIIEVLLDQSRGMFIWVKLQIDSFFGPQSRMRHPKDVEKKIEMLKRGNETRSAAKLHQVYEEIYDFNTEKGSPSRDIADRAFKWMMCAQRSLHLTELVEAASIDDDSTVDQIQTADLLRICSNFISFDESNVVDFPHASAREYLLFVFDKRKGFSQDHRHISIAKICLMSLTHPVSGVKSFKVLQGNVFGYSIVYWATHLAKVASDKWPESLQCLYKEFLFGKGHNPLGTPRERPRNLQQRDRESYQKDNKSLCMSWLEILPKIQQQIKKIDKDQEMRLRNCISEPPTTLFAACVFGFVDMVPKYMSTADADNPNPAASSPLWLASHYANYDVAVLLLEKGAEVEAENYMKHTALLAASMNGDERIMQSLLERFARVNIWFTHDGTSLYKALENGHQKAAHLLLQYGADTSVRGEHSQTALWEASERGYEDAVRFLLQANADVDARDESGATSLTVASRSGHAKIVQLLLQSGASVNLDYSHAPTALYEASEKGHETIVALLLNENADVNAGGGSFHTPLLAASIKGFEVIVELLLREPGIDLKTKNQGRIAIRYALELGYVKIGELLLEKGVISDRQALLNAALTFASGRRFSGTVQPLLEKIAEISGEELRRALLQPGLEKDHMRLMRTLIDTGADVNTLGYCGDDFWGTVLQRASDAGDNDFVEMLLGCPNIDVNNQRRKSPALHLASENGHDVVVQLLLSHKKIAINAECGQHSTTALYTASSNGYEKIVRLLLDQPDIDSNAHGLWGTALHASLVNRYTEVCHLLLGHKDIDVDRRGFHGSPLQIVRELIEKPGYKRIEQVLLDKGATLNAKTGFLHESPSMAPQSPYPPPTRDETHISDPQPPLTPRPNKQPLSTVRPDRAALSKPPTARTTAAVKLTAFMNRDRVRATVCNADRQTGNTSRDPNTPKVTAPAKDESEASTDDDPKNHRPSHKAPEMGKKRK